SMGTENLSKSHQITIKSGIKNRPPSTCSLRIYSLKRLRTILDLVCKFLGFFRKRTVRLIIGSWYIEKYGEPRKELLEKGFDLKREYGVTVSLEKLITTYTQTRNSKFSQVFN
ncbi:MAG: hypothetical protein ACUZ8I_07365, partial [Candidatus Scalindua sp.]